MSQVLDARHTPEFISCGTASPQSRNSSANSVLPCRALQPNYPRRDSNTAIARLRRRNSEVFPLALFRPARLNSRLLGACGPRKREWSGFYRCGSGLDSARFDSAVRGLDSRNPDTPNRPQRQSVPRAQLNFCALIPNLLPTLADPTLASNYARSAHDPVITPHAITGHAQLARHHNVPHATFPIPPENFSEYAFPAPPKRSGRKKGRQDAQLLM